MFHVLLGWQAGVRTQIAVELDMADPGAKEVSQALKDRYGELTKTPKKETILAMFRLLREQCVRSDEGLRRWVACLALVRTWRDEVETVGEIATVTRRITGPPTQACSASQGTPHLSSS